MADVTLGDYTAYVFLEMLKAREMADAYSRLVAERYRDDGVLQHFPVPRFRVPKMELTIPVLVSGAHFRQTVRFDFPEDQFVRAVTGIASDVRATVESSVITRLPRPRAVVSSGVQKLATEFHQALVANPDPSRPEGIVTVMWGRIFRQCLGEARLLDDYERTDPEHRLLTRTTDQVLQAVRARTPVDQTALEALLVNPETNAVKNGSTEASVFTINAELVEEGFYLRSVEEDGKPPRPVVEFE